MWFKLADFRSFMPQFKVFLIGEKYMIQQIVSLVNIFPMYGIFRAKIMQNYAG